jgi:hypothetical protein
LFTFFGAFADRHPGIARQFLQRWPDINIVEIENPFQGLAIRFQESVYAPEEEDLPESVSTAAQEISRQIPGARFVLLRTEC